MALHLAVLASNAEGRALLLDPALGRDTLRSEATLAKPGSDPPAVDASVTEPLLLQKAHCQLLTCLRCMCRHKT